MMRRIRHRVALFGATAILASTGGVLLTSGVAHADLPSGKTFDLAGGGSDTTTPVMDAIAAIASPGHSGSDTNLFDSFDATGSTTVNTTDPFSAPASGNCTTQARPNGSGQGIKAVAGTLTGTTAGCFQFARMSRGPSSSDPTGFTWIPFAIDVVDFAVTNTSAIPRTLSLAELQGYYTCQASLVGTQSSGNPGFNEYARNPVLPQSGSGTRLFWEALMGITDSAVGSGTFGGGTLGCIINGVNPDNPTQIWEEHTGTLLGDYELEPFSIPQYEIQSESLIPDLRGRSVLGDIAYPTESVTGGTNTTTAITLDMANTQGFVKGSPVTVTFASGSWTSINGTWIVTNVVANTSVSFTVTTAPTGTITTNILAVPTNPWQPAVLNAANSSGATALTGLPVPNQFEREVYNVVPTSEVTGSAALNLEIQQVFVGSTSDLCSPTAFGGAIQATILQFHLLPDPNCGSTTLTH